MNIAGPPTGPPAVSAELAVFSLGIGDGLWNYLPVVFEFSGYSYIREFQATGAHFMPIWNYSICGVSLYINIKCEILVGDKKDGRGRMIPPAAFV